MKKKIYNFLTSDYFPAVAICFVIFGLMFVMYQSGKMAKVNELCNRYNGNLEFCEVKSIQYIEHN